MAFLPQFVRPAFGKDSLQILGLGVMVVLVAVVVEIGFVLAACRAANFFHTNRHASIWLDRTLGCVLIGLGIRMIF
jgi:threonine/homoserine/homoserine lactone efflux protein